MSALRFRVGEIAIVVASKGSGHHPSRTHNVRAGDEVEVFRVGPFMEGEPCTQPNAVGAFHAGAEFDYECRHPSGVYFFCCDMNLRKRPQPGIPESVRSWFEVKLGETA